MHVFIMEKSLKEHYTALVSWMVETGYVIYA